MTFGTYADPIKSKEGEVSLKSSTVQYKVDKVLLKRLLLDIGYKILSDEDKLLILAYQDFKVGLMSGNDTSIQFYSSFTTDKKIKWNSPIDGTKRCGIREVIRMQKAG